MTQLTTDQWEAKYKPITNHLSADASWNGLMFETYDAEFDFVREQPDNRVWTWVDGEDGTYLITGIAFVNRIGYFVTTEPWETNEEVKVDSYLPVEILAIKELANTFPKLQVGTDEDGLLVIYTNVEADEEELYEHFLEVISCTMDNTTQGEK